MKPSVNPRRRRGLGVVTPNACTECRKKRAKCDGGTPCGRCVSQQGIECIYEVPTRQSKATMRTEIENLRKYRQQSERIFSALASRDQADQVFDLIRKGETLDSIDRRLRDTTSTKLPTGNITTYARAGDFQAINNALQPAQSTTDMQSAVLRFGELSQGSLPQQNPTSNMWQAINDVSNQSLYDHAGHQATSWPLYSITSANSVSHHPVIGVWHQQAPDYNFDGITQSARSRGQEVLLGEKIRTEDPLTHLSSRAGETWTTVTSDRSLVEHLLALYFCWEYPTFASLSKEHFIEDFRKGIPRYCSSLLVNALLAMACRFSDRVGSRSDLNDETTAGDHFFFEAQRLLDAEEDLHVLTTIQALGLMSIREASRGNVSQGIFLSGQSIRLAIEMGLHLDVEDDEEDEATDRDQAVREATFWGAFSLDLAWSLCIGSLPQFSSNANLIAKPAILQNVEAASWIPYSDDGAPIELNCTQPSNIRSAYKTFCELSEIAHRSLYALYTPGVNVTSKTLLAQYSQYINWYDTIPDSLRLGHNFTPAVLFAHLYYHGAILLLFRPFIKLQIIASDVVPKDVCWQAANAISAIVNSYSNLYSLRRTPSFVPLFVLLSSIVHLCGVANELPYTGSKEKLVQGVEALKEMSGSHGFANRAMEILHSLARMWKIDALVDTTDTTRNPNKKYGRCAMPANKFSPNIEGLITMQSITLLSSADENPLFSPFPMQGQPSLATGSQLEEDGFKRAE